MKTKLKNALLGALSWATRASRTVLEFLLPLLQSAMASTLETLLPLAAGIVAEVAARSDLSGTEKRDLAASKLKSAALQAGVNAGVSTLNLAVEMALAKLKSEAAQ